MEQPIDLNQSKRSRYHSWPYSQDICQSCGLCAGSCPVSGIDGFDPRKLVRMVSLGFKEEIVETKWPWVCTMCGKCEHVCPMGIRIPDMVRGIRSLRDREHVPGIIHKGVEAALKTGNNLALPEDDFIFILEDVAEEIAAEPDFEGFTVPINKTGADLLITIHNKLVNTHTEDLKPLWKILHAADENWTVPSKNWEGCNWGYFSGNDDSMKAMIGRIVEQMTHLQVKNLLWPE